MTATIRRALADDHDELVDVWLRSVRATHDFLTEEDVLSLWQQMRAGALTGLETWALCDENERPVGFVALSGAKMEALFLAPEWQGQGYGRRLVEHARRLKGPLAVDVNEQNPAALKFYLACGFQVTGSSATDSGGRPFPLLHLREIGGDGTGGNPGASDAGSMA